MQLLLFLWRVVGVAPLTQGDICVNVCFLSATLLDRWTSSLKSCVNACMQLSIHQEESKVVQFWATRVAWPFQEQSAVIRQAAVQEWGTRCFDWVNTRSKRAFPKGFMCEITGETRPKLFIKCPQWLNEITELPLHHHHHHNPLWWIYIEYGCGRAVI